MLNILWTWMLLTSVVVGALTGRLDAVAQASVTSAKGAASLALGLVGIMALWLGLMRVLHEAGLMRWVARMLRPILCRLFPDLPHDHPALGMMVLNITSNLLGLGNAATPFGLKTMRALERLNRHPGIATNSMVRFLALNTAGLSLFPTGMIALRASMGSSSPGAIFLPTLISSSGAALAGLLASKLLAPLYPLPHTAGRSIDDGAEAHSGADPTEKDALEPQEASHRRPEAARPKLAGLLFALLVFALCFGLWQKAQLTPGPLGLRAAIHEAIGTWPLILLMCGFVLIGVGRGVAVYDAIVAGGREGFDVAVRIIPYLVAILVAVGMLRASGAIDATVALLAPYTAVIGLPAEALPMVLLRPLTGSGAYAVVADTLTSTGADSLASDIACTIMGTTETTFYVLAVYLGAVGVRQSRHAVWVCLFADAIGVLLATWTCRVLLHG